MRLTPIGLNYSKISTEAEEFRDFLGAHDQLKERRDILPFFKARAGLSTFINSYNGRANKHDCYAHEYPLFGDFVCDLVVGDLTNKAYTFVEFEDAAPNSIFLSNARSIPEWSRRFEHGFSQILDWFHKLDSHRHSTEFETRFNGRDIHAMGLLVIGRTQNLSSRERERLDWRHTQVLVNGKQIFSVTYDGLCETLIKRLEWIREITGTTGGT